MRLIADNLTQDQFNTLYEALELYYGMNEQRWFATSLTTIVIQGTFIDDYVLTHIKSL